MARELLGLAETPSRRYNVEPVDLAETDAVAERIETGRAGGPGAADQRSST